MLLFFEDHTLDIDRRELSRGSKRIEIEPQVFDLLVYLVQNRDRVVSKDDLVKAVWKGTHRFRFGAQQQNYRGSSCDWR